MITKNGRRAGAAKVLLLVATCLHAGNAFGQTRVGPDGPEIIVEAPRAVHVPIERSPYTRAPVVTTTIQIPALYGDLDLAKPTDAARLMTRLNRVAHDACMQLDQLYPLNPDPDCVGVAVAHATITAKKVIAAAREKGTRRHRGI